MRLNDIEFCEWVSPTIPENVIIDNGTVVGQFDIYDIVNVHDYYLILDENHQYMGYVRLDFFDNFKELYVPVKHRKKGIASSIILFLLKDKKKKLRLSSDEWLTDDSRSILFNLASKGKIKISQDDRVMTMDQISHVFTNLESDGKDLILESKLIVVPQIRYELWNPKLGLAGSEEIWFGDKCRPAFWFD